MIFILQYSVVSFFFHDSATTEIYTLSLHDALPISSRNTVPPSALSSSPRFCPRASVKAPRSDRKSTRLNSSHSSISYAVFCLKKKTSLGRGRRGLVLKIPCVYQASPSYWPSTPIPF